MKIYLIISFMINMFHFLHLVIKNYNEEKLIISRLDILLLIIFPTSVIYITIITIFNVIFDFISSLKILNWLTKPMKFNLNKDKKE